MDFVTHPSKAMRRGTQQLIVISDSTNGPRDAKSKKLLNCFDKSMQIVHLGTRRAIMGITTQCVSV